MYFLPLIKILNLVYPKLKVLSCRQGAGIAIAICLSIEKGICKCRNNLFISFFSNIFISGYNKHISIAI